MHLLRRPNCVHCVSSRSPQPNSDCIKLVALGIKNRENKRRLRKGRRRKDKWRSKGPRKLKRLKREWRNRKRLREFKLS